DPNGKARLADLDLDGNLDLVVPGPMDQVTLFRGQGNGQFDFWSAIPVSDHPLAVAIGDLDGDGRPDLVVSRNFNPSVAVLLVSGDGGFTAGAEYPIGDHPFGVLLVDLDRDSHLDLLAGDTFGDLSLLRGRGDGTFASPERYGTGNQ